jgi:hypothetical protein
MEQLSGALITLPAAKLLRKLDPTCKPAGSIAINVASLLKEAQAAAAATRAVAVDTKTSSDQQHEQQLQVTGATAAAGQQCAKLSTEQVLSLLKLLCCQQLNPRLLATELAQHAPKQQHTQQPNSTAAAAASGAAAAGHMEVDMQQQQQQCPESATAVPSPPAASASTAAAAAAAAAEQAKLAAEQAAEVPVGGLPLTSLDLSSQPLGLPGWQLLLQLMHRTNCLQRLVLSDCSIEAAGAGGDRCEGQHNNSTWRTPHSYCISESLFVWLQQACFHVTSCAYAVNTCSPWHHAG